MKKFIGLILIVSVAFLCKATSNTVLITEVFYDTPGRDSDEEWIEIVNISSFTIDISNYKLGDEETKGGREGMYKFPSGTFLLPGQVIVVALKATGFYDLYGINPDFEMIDTNPSVPDMIKYLAWASGSIALSNSGDEVLLLDGSDNVVDVVIYENGSFSGVLPHPGVSTGHSIERVDTTDTDDCGIDFIDREPETPGVFSAFPTLTIREIQYTTNPSGDSPYKNQRIKTSGIVTGVFFNGFFMQDSEGEWNGIWVYTNSSPKVDLGDFVIVVGKVQEYYQNTEIYMPDITVMSSGNPLPNPLVLTTGSVSQEMYEGVLVEVQNVRVTSVMNRYGEWFVDDGSGSVMIDDMGDYTYFPCAGDRIAFVIGPLYYSYGNFKIEPRDDSDIGKVDLGFCKFQTNINIQTKPLASNNINKANELLLEAENLLKMAKEAGKEIDSCRELIVEAKKLIEQAKALYVGKNYIAANSKLAKAIKILEKAISCLSNPRTL